LKGEKNQKARPKKKNKLIRRGRAIRACERRNRIPITEEGGSKREGGTGGEKKKKAKAERQRSDKSHMPDGRNLLKRSSRKKMKKKILAKRNAL